MKKNILIAKLDVCTTSKKIRQVTNYLVKTNSLDDVRVMQLSVVSAWRRGNFQQRACTLEGRCGY